MISVFVSTRTDDFKWRNNPGPDLNDEPMSTIGVFQCHLRLIPSTSPLMVLPCHVSTFHDFMTCIKDGDSKSNQDYADAMNTFICNFLKEIKNSELSSFQNEPLCVFIHFGDGEPPTYNQRLHNAWVNLAPDSKNRFLCFAITKNGKSGDILKNAGLKTDDGDIYLPDNNEELKRLLIEGWKAWRDDNSPLPGLFANLKDVSSIPESGKMPQPHQANPPESHHSSSANDKNGGLKNVNSITPQDNNERILLTTLEAFILKVMIALELLLGFVFLEIKCIFAKSSIIAIIFGGLGLVYLIISVVILLKSHVRVDEEKNSSRIHENVQ